jgi:hypothetical protein
MNNFKQRLPLGEPWPFETISVLPTMKTLR